MLAALLVTAAQAQDPSSFQVGEVRAAPGQRSSGFLEIPDGVDEGTRVPVTVIHGRAPGPVLGLIAGTHGYEYAPILALQNIREQVDPEQLSGTLILVHVANLPSFLGRTIYYSPIDGQNLNRAFPGRPDGSVSERIAYALTREVLERSDVVLDMHAGDGNEDLRPFVYMPVTGERALDERMRNLARAFGIDHVVIDEARAIDPAASQFVDHTAVSRGIPALTTETGQLGSTDDPWVAMAEDGVWGVMAHLGMVDRAPELAEGVVWLGDYEVVSSPATGLFRPAVRSGYAVVEGTLLGTLVDFFGDPIAEIRAPFAGVVNYVLGTPPVSEGEPLAMVSRVQEGG
jgi:predicted deacylase